jgi:uncharacterized protein
LGLVQSVSGTEQTVSGTQKDNQQVCRDRTLVCLGSRLDSYQKMSVEIRAQLQPYIETLVGLRQKLSQPLLQIAVFGLVSRGKSAVLNALFGEILFPTGPLNGVTQWPRSVRWSPTLGQAQAPSLQLELTDTPGLDEISGEVRAAMAQNIARCADLILFVSAGPLMPIEEEAMVELAQFSKPMIWVVNKADLYPDLSAESLYQALSDEGLKTIISPKEIVMTAAAPAPVQVRHEWPDGRVSVEWEESPPRIEDLRQTLMELLNREGLYLLSLNTLLQIESTEQMMIEAIAQFYAEPVQLMQWRLWGVKAVMVGVVPWVWLDLGFSFLLDVFQVRRLMKTYGLPATGHEIESLWKTLALSVGLMGVAEVSTTLMDGALLPTLLTQGAIAVYGASLVGRSAQQYLTRGATWATDGPSLLIQQVFSELTDDMVVYRLAWGSA